MEEASVGQGDEGSAREWEEAQVRTRGKEDRDREVGVEGARGSVGNTSGRVDERRRRGIEGVVTSSVVVGIIRARRQGRVQEGGERR